MTHFDVFGRNKTGYLRFSAQNCKLPALHFIQDVGTKWNSTHQMLQRLREQNKALNPHSVNKGGIEILSKPEWELVDRDYSRPEA